MILNIMLYECLIERVTSNQINSFRDDDSMCFVCEINEQIPSNKVNEIN